jgi:hypothetical protein
LDARIASGPKPEHLASRWRSDPDRWFDYGRSRASEDFNYIVNEVAATVEFYIAAFRFKLDISSRPVSRKRFTALTAYALRSGTRRSATSRSFSLLR